MIKGGCHLMKRVKSKSVKLKCKMHVATLIQSIMLDKKL